MPEVLHNDRSEHPPVSAVDAAPSQIAEMRAEIAVLHANNEALRVDNAVLLAKLAEIDAKKAWRALKSCDPGPYTYECVRLWCVDGRITAKKPRGRWFVDEASLSGRLAMLAAFDR